MGSAVVKPLARRRGKIKQNTVDIDPANDNEKENAAGSRESTTNCKLNVLADSTKNIRQPFFGKPRKDDDDKTQSNPTVCCTYVFFSGKGKAYDSDEELSQVQPVRKRNVSPSQTKHNQQNGTHLSQHVQKIHNPCLAAKCADLISQSQFMQGDNGECLLQSQVTQPLGCATVTPVCSKVSDIIHGEAQSMQMCSGNPGNQSQKELLAVQENTLRVHKDEPIDRISLPDQHVCCEDSVQSPEYDHLEEVKVINTNFSVREQPHADSPPLQSCGQSSETKVTTTASNVGVSCSKTKHSPELTCQQRLDIGDQVYIKPSPCVEYTKSQCRGAGESLSAHLNYSHNICLISSDVQKRCFQALCQDYELKQPKASSSDYRCFPLCTKSPRVEGNKSVNATDVTRKSETGETLECNENNAIHFSDSFGDVIKRPLLPDFANSSSTSLSYKGTVMKCDKSSDSSSLNHPHVEDVLAVGEEFLDEIEEVFLQQNSSQFPCMEKGKCITPEKENDDRLQTPSKHGTRASLSSSCSSKHSETTHEWRGSRPGSSVKPSTLSSGSVLAHVSTSKALIEPSHDNNELPADIFIQAAPYHRLSNTKQALMNSELEYGPGYIDDILFKGSSIPSRACSSRESLQSTRAAQAQSIINSETLPKEGSAIPLLCFSKESLNSTKAAKSQSVTDNDIMLNDRKVPSVARSINSVLHHESAVPSQSTSNKDVLRADSKVPSNESLTDQISALMQSVEDIEITNRGSRAASRTCSCKDSVHSVKGVLSRHFSNNEIMLSDSRAPSRPCSSKSSLKSTKLVLIPSTLNTSEMPKGCTSVLKACSCNESLHTDRPVISESISSNEIIPHNKGVPSMTSFSKASLQSSQLVTTQPIQISGEISKDCRPPSKQCSSNESLRSSETIQTNLPQNTMRKDSMHPPRECSSKDSLQSIGVIHAQHNMSTCNETQNFTSKNSPPSVQPDITIVQIASKNLSSRPPSSKRSSSSSEHIQGHPRPESNKHLVARSEFVQLNARPHSRQSRHSLNASRPSSSLEQPELGDSAQGNELLYGTSEITRNRKGSDIMQGAASFYDGNRQLNVKDSLESAPVADIAKSEVTNQPLSNTCGSRYLHNSDVPAVASEDTSSFAHFCLSNTLATLNQTLKSRSRSSMSSRTGTNDEPGEISHEHLATPKETISLCSSSLCPPADSLTAEPTSEHLAVQVENTLAIDANSSAALASAQSYCLSPEKIGNIRRQLYEEGFKPAEREGGVAFFIPVTEDGMQPQTDGAVVAERLTKTKKASLNFEERMFIANINRQVQLSKKKEFAVRDIRNVKGAASSSDGSDRTKQNDDVDDFDISV